jgi:hypothetical protein
MHDLLGELATNQDYNFAMPLIFRENGFRFFFYSNEGAPREPVHIHVEKDGRETKFWMKPEVRVACY